MLIKQLKFDFELKLETQVVFNRHMPMETERLIPYTYRMVWRYRLLAVLEEAMVY